MESVKQDQELRDAKQKIIDEMNQQKQEQERRAHEEEQESMRASQIRSSRIDMKRK